MTARQLIARLLLLAVVNPAALAVLAAVLVELWQERRAQRPQPGAQPPD